MKTLSFKDANVAEAYFRDQIGPVAETLDSPKRTLLDYDGEGRLVDMTIHEAYKNAEPALVRSPMRPGGDGSFQSGPAEV